MATTALLRALLAHLDGAELTLARSVELVTLWLLDCDRGAPLDGDYNAMHVAGAALCAALDARAVALPAPEELGDAEVRARLFVAAMDAPGDAPAAAPAAAADAPAAAAADAAALAAPIAEYAAPALQAFLANLQAEFGALYTLTDDGYVCAVDLTLMLLAVMRRLGHWLRHAFLPPPGDVSLRDVAAPGPANWHTLRADVVRHMLDAIHTMLAAHRLLISAQPLPPAAPPCEIHPVHREASMDAWWELATVADCPIGGITQYKNRFQFLFHSVSQVIYYHYPSYTRRAQRPFADIRAGVCPPLHALPLLLQVAPDIPVLYEHTGAGYRPLVRKQPYAWCVLGTFVLLLDEHMRAFCARDFLTLLAKTQTPQ